MYKKHADGWIYVFLRTKVSLRKKKTDRQTQPTGPIDRLSDISARLTAHFIPGGGVPDFLPIHLHLGHKECSASEKGKSEENTDALTHCELVNFLLDSTTFPLFSSDSH